MTDAIPGLAAALADVDSAQEAARAAHALLGDFPLPRELAALRALANVVRAKVAEDAGTWTVLGLWYQDEAIPVGAIAGRHDVYGEPPYGFSEQGTWALAVTADDPDTAQDIAAGQMEAENNEDDDNEEIPV